MVLYLIVNFEARRLIIDSDTSDETIVDVHKLLSIARSVKPVESPKMARDDVGHYLMHMQGRLPNALGLHGFYSGDNLAGLTHSTWFSSLRLANLNALAVFRKTLLQR